MIISLQQAITTAGVKTFAGRYGAYQKPRNDGGESVLLLQFCVLDYEIRE